MKEFIQKHEEIIAGFAVFALILGDLYSVNFMVSLAYSNPLGTAFLLLPLFAINFYFHYLYSERNRK